MQKPVDTTTVEPISAVERKRRRDGMNFAIANVELEGGQVGEDFKADAQRYVDGEITFEEFGALQLAKK
jgi:hypothetical protein